MSSGSGKIDKAMILAAGLGSRLRPLTDTVPKPMVPVAGRPLIDYAFDLVRGAGIGSVVVNVHHLAEQVERHVQTITDLEVTLSDERGALLETGGGVRKVLPCFEGRPFAVLNSDVIIRDGRNGSLKQLMDRWDPDQMDALLLMQATVTLGDYTGLGDFEMDGLGRLTRREERTVTPFMFAGVQILTPDLFEGITEEAFSLNRIYDKAAENGRLYGLTHSGQWLHVGTPDAVEQANRIIAGS
ncbi:nucleotidyltransferase family protein [Sneathiella chinensis]|uniref:Mannose-1-phosphate guanylyltransferase n=1 Tax=Sneathiella chinensis TaxID=349750 RepID=A0ABQ5TZ80_9PROT|nr:nucleotidyltransferase family protein [Sneathiella chinensis]GLQ04868.1 mannose-1-phosphate guanylyltransferase [Sneathiella chinensis]